MEEEGVEEDGIKSKECVIVSLNCLSKVKQQQATDGTDGREEGWRSASGRGSCTNALNEVATVTWRSCRFKPAEAVLEGA